MRTLALGLALLFPSFAWAVCPVGTIPNVDMYGNQICQNIQTGGTRSIEGSVKQCPTGSIPAVDNFGNRICKNFATNQQFYDTSKGCPIGMHPGVDTFGNPVCQRN